MTLLDANSCLALSVSLPPSLTFCISPLRLLSPSLFLWLFCASSPPLPSILSVSLHLSPHLPSAPASPLPPDLSQEGEGHPPPHNHRPPRPPTTQTTGYPASPTPGA